MGQVSFLNCPVFPLTYDDLHLLYEKYIYEGEKDDDVFTWSEIKEGRSYSMYGKKVLEFYPGDMKKARLYIFPLDKNEKRIALKAADPVDSLISSFDSLKQMKRTIFRNTITEVFGCCNDFKKCSAIDACIHQEDRFYNGCMYRTNLEAGRNFYKESSSNLKPSHFTNIIGLDFETANAGRSSACAVSAIKYDLSGVMINRYSTLINPYEDFDYFNIMIHGITPEMVSEAPDIREAMKKVFCLIDSNSLVVCHNAAFDMSVLRNSLLKNPIDIPDFSFTCTYRLASRVLPKKISYSLPDVAEMCGIKGLIHHDASSDADVCAKILLYLIKMFDGDIDRLHQTANIKYGHFQDGEYDGIHKNVRESLSPPHSSNRKLPKFTVGESSPFFGKVVVFTGQLESMTRNEAIEIINKIGGIGSISLTKKTNILVTGYQNPSVLAGKEKSNKRLAAEKLLAEGREIEIIPEEEFIKLL